MAVRRLWYRLLATLADLGLGSRTRVKERAEFAYWQERARREGVLANAHYRHFFTTHFGLDENDYSGARILDVGCGPRGSLEWAAMAAQRIGLDPLADRYAGLQLRALGMQLVKGYCEALPFADDSFDVVSSFNSIDHVEDLSRSCSELQRVLRPGGWLLVLTDVHERATVGEPQSISWDFAERYLSPLQLEGKGRYASSGRGLYESVRAGRSPAESSTADGGVLSLKLRKPPAEVT